MATIRSIRLFDGQIQFRILACNLPAKHIFHLFHCEHLISYPIISYAVSAGMENYFIKNQITNCSVCTAGSTCCKHSFPEYESIYFCFPTSPCCCFNICNNQFLEERLNRTGRFQPNLPRSTIVRPIFPRAQKTLYESAINFRSSSSSAARYHVRYAFCILDLNTASESFAVSRRSTSSI